MVDVNLTSFHETTYQKYTSIPQGTLKKSLFNSGIPVKYCFAKFSDNIIQYNLYINEQSNKMFLESSLKKGGVF